MGAQIPLALLALQGIQTTVDISRAQSDKKQQQQATKLQQQQKQQQLAQQKVNDLAKLQHNLSARGILTNTGYGYRLKKRITKDYDDALKLLRTNTSRQLTQNQQNLTRTTQDKYLSLSRDTIKTLRN